MWALPWEGCDIRTKALTSACLLKKERSPLFSSLIEEGPARKEPGAQVCQALKHDLSHIFTEKSLPLAEGGRGCGKAVSEPVQQVDGTGYLE